MPVATRCRWEEKLVGSTFADARLEQRLHRLVGHMGRSLGASVPFACQDWASTKVVYCFFRRMGQRGADPVGSLRIDTRACAGQ
ncbi:IS4/Tn5 family transposase DNA-binding protein [Methylobacterium aquaticum]|uniref:IS4/Tn5 family transposase DNA-binding protein n=1 Tax=Methylobacterium aquaticum TaxID=270351 RepID=UPI001932824D|nr:hypothetical protein F1D61_22690 [Methylobacterium aquaticum]